MEKQSNAYVRDRRRLHSAVSHCSNWWLCHDTGSPVLAAKLSLCTARWFWILCLTTSAHSRTLAPSNRAWQLGCFPGTSVRSALETFATIALYKLTYTIYVYHTKPCWLIAYFGIFILHFATSFRNNLLFYATYQIRITVCKGSAYNPSIMGREGLCAALSAVRADLSTREQDACLFCRFATSPSRR